jgi:type I restriction enzyme S subunit
MSGWVESTLNDVCVKITDGAHQSPKTVINGKPMASVKDLTFYGINIDTARSISEEDYQSLVRQGCKPETGDVLIAKDGNSALDTVCVVKEDIDIVLLSSVAILRPNKNFINPEFLKFYFRSPKVIEYLKNNFISGAAIPRVVLRDFKKAKINVPVLNMQERIVSILCALDYKIHNNNKVNETLEKIAQAIFKSWFVDFDPVKAKASIMAKGGSIEDATIAAMQTISGKSAYELKMVQAESPDAYLTLKRTAELFPSSFTDSPLGPIPEGWEVKGLDEIANYLNGLALQKFRPLDDNDFLPVLKIAQLSKGSVEGADKASPNIKSEYIVKDGDIIFSWSGSLMVDVWCGGTAALNQHLFKVTSINYPKWLLKAFQQPTILAASSTLSWLFSSARSFCNLPLI